MKFTLSWLKEYLDTKATLEQIVQTLTMIGLEVESVVDRSKELSAFKIAQILEAKPHPDADKLRVCMVETGTEKLQIVCGAPNARPGINVVLAPVGATIPGNGLKIKASKIRGVDSNGMLCSAAELGLGDDHSGIIEMPACNDNLAKNFADVVGLNDPVIEIAITPNRGDCLGVYGIARDLAAAGLGTLKPLKITPVKGAFDSPVTIGIEDAKKCPVFMGRYFKGIKNGASPEWLQQRLKAIGLKPISTLVDITNYINYGFGRPLHVYDAKKLQGGLAVRGAKAGEKILALNDKEYTLAAGMTVIADSKGPQAIGGIIGGAASGCSEDTTEVVLEVALFDPADVANTGRALEILTDSRYRFERKVDAGFVVNALELASQMIIELCGGQASKPVTAGAVPAAERSIAFDFGKVQSLGGIDISPARSKEILQTLGFVVNGEKVSIPSWRPDVEGQEDLVEEVVRIHGYDHIPTVALQRIRDALQPVLTGRQKRMAQTRRTLATRGMVEAITWSFMNGQDVETFCGKPSSLSLANPISSDWNVMRPSMLPNLIKAAQYNADRGQKDVAFFELGLIYRGAAIEEQVAAASGIRSGFAEIKNVHGAERKVDVFDAKADVLTALEASNVPVLGLKITQDAPKWYHPGRSGVLRLGKDTLAYFGEIHPAILKAWDIKMPVVGFELFFDAIPAAKTKKSKARKKLQISEYQRSVRDFAFLIDGKTTAELLLKAVQGVDKELISDVTIFDVYQGKGVEPGKKSVAISATIQPKDRTLTDAELEALSQKIIQAVTALGGVLRG